MPVWFFVLSVLFMFLLSRILTPRLGHQVLATVIGTALVHGWYLSLTPNAMGNHLFPFALFALYSYASRASYAQTSIVLLVGLAMIPLHPLPALAMVLAAAVVFVVPRMYSLTASSAQRLKSVSRGLPSSVVLLLGMAWVAWMASFPAWAAFANNVRLLLTEGGETSGDRLLQRAAEAQQYGFSLVDHAIREYGGQAIIVLLAVALLPVVVRRVRHDFHQIGPLSVYGFMAAITLVMIVLFILNPFFGPTRLLFYVSVSACPLAGYALYEFLTWSTQRAQGTRSICVLAVGMLLSVVILNGVLSVYPSRYTNAANRQTTVADVQGVEWFFLNKGSTTEVTYWGVNLRRFSAFLLTPPERQALTIARCVPDDSWGIRPHHLGYSVFDTIGQSYTTDAYMILVPEDRVLYTEVFPELTDVGLLPNDLARMDGDPTVERQYSNGALDLWYITAT